MSYVEWVCESCAEFIALPARHGWVSKGGKWETILTLGRDAADLIDAHQFACDGGQDE